VQGNVAARRGDQGSVARRVALQVAVTLVTETTTFASVVRHRVWATMPAAE
jgi:hypothetical protein